MFWCHKRLLLRANPTITLIELHRINYDDKRMPMFLSFTTEFIEKKINVVKIYDIWKTIKEKMLIYFDISYYFYNFLII